MRNSEVRGAARWCGAILLLVTGVMSGFSHSGEVSPSVRSIALIGGAPYYSPVETVATAGQPIEWINRTASPHTVTHVGCLEGSGRCAFDSGALAPGARFSVYYLPPGRYPYRCRLHPIMEGMVIVREPVRVATLSSRQR